MKTEPHGAHGMHRWKRKRRARFWKLLRIPPKRMFIFENATLLYTSIREICAMNGRTRQDAHTAVAEARLGVCFAYRLLSLDALTNKNKITLLRDSPGDFGELLLR